MNNPDSGQGTPLVLTSVVARSSGILSAEIDDEIAMLDIERGICFGMNKLASRIWELVQKARESLARAVLLGTGNGDVRLRAAELLSHDIPYRYVERVADAVPYARYEEALRKTIQPGDLVLDLGAGTGVLAMVAARVGGRVVLCDKDVSLADAVTEVIA